MRDAMDESPLSSLVSVNSDNSHQASRLAIRLDRSSVSENPDEKDLKAKKLPALTDRLEQKLGYLLQLIWDEFYVCD